MPESMCGRYVSGSSVTLLLECLAELEKKQSWLVKIMDRGAHPFWSPVKVIK
jgi:hypothetical protein